MNFRQVLLIKQRQLQIRLIEQFTNLFTAQSRDPADTGKAYVAG
jgi:hypothetical protein